MVIIQFPMCNEKMIYQRSLGAIAQMKWLRDRMPVQVLDDSDEEEPRLYNVKYQRRSRLIGCMVDILVRCNYIDYDCPISLLPR
ncbi:hypothetical protein GOP47_0015744 [Adiantum capillus-veneris]|uniref:Uncharacterized protein n=1 Tax=Adiantum capillus-veneris TaxID=13818 RepID=A0A9D4ZBH8_ADICA|nr:hypothetical protein GOP47_0015744 [Adiantum capillus-veneris]